MGGDAHKCLAYYTLAVKPFSVKFYKSCAFEEFKMPSDANDCEKLGQLFCFLNDKPTTGGFGSQEAASIRNSK